MYVCMYLRVYVCMYLYVCVCVYVCMYVCVCVCVYVCVFVSVFTCTYVRTCVKLLLKLGKYARVLENEWQTLYPVSSNWNSHSTNFFPVRLSNMRNEAWHRGTVRSINLAGFRSLNGRIQWTVGKWQVNGGCGSGISCRHSDANTWCCEKRNQNVTRWFPTRCQQVTVSGSAH